MATKIIETTIDSLIPDGKNFNKGTEFGGHLIEKSLRQFGAGRSILLDKNNNIIAGNKTTENCANIGLERVIIVETDGNALVAVKRKDVDINTPQGREMALADNATSAANLEWNEPELMECAELMDIDPADWGVDIKQESGNGDDNKQNKKISNDVLVHCKSASEQERLFYDLQARGYDVELR